MLSGKNIYKKYGVVEVLKGVDIEIRKGEVVSIVGPSGSGKSTLLHIIGTLDKADSGTVSMNGTLLNSLSSKKMAAFRNKHIGFVFQFHHLLPEFSAIENVYPRLAGWPEKERSGRKSQEITANAEPGPSPGK